MTEAEYEELLAPRCSSLRRFIRTFIFSKGATEIVLITALSSLGAAGVVGLVRNVNVQVFRTAYPKYLMFLIRCLLLFRFQTR